MRRLLLLCVFHLIIVKSFSQVSETAIPIGTSGDDRLTSVDVDPSGNIVALISAEGNFQIGATPIQVVGNFARNVLVKMDDAGNVFWHRAYGSDIGFLQGLETDGQGNIYIAGQNSSNANLSGTIIPFSGRFLAKLDPAGNPIWVQNFGYGFGSNVHIMDMEVNANGDVAIGGSYTGTTLNIGGQSFTSNGVRDAWVAKFDSNGNYLWAASEGGSNYDHIKGVSLDPAGNVLAIGTGLSNPVIAGTTIPTGDIYILKYDPNGGLIWLRTFGSSGVTSYQDNPMDVETDPFGNVYVTGWLDDTTSIGSFNGVGGHFITQLTPGGVYKWAKGTTGSGSLGSTAHQNIHGKMAIRGDALAVTSLSRGEFWDGDTLGTPSALSAFTISVMRLDTLGDLKWVNFQEGTSTMRIQELDWSPDQTIWLASYGEGDITMDGRTFPNQGNEDGLLVEILDSANVIRGEAFRDFNLNTTRDAGDSGFEGIIVEIQPGNRFYSTNSDGIFNAFVPVGNFTASLANPPLYYTTPISSFNIPFTNLGNSNNSAVFALQPSGNITDDVLNFAQSVARPGFGTTFWLSVENIGTVSSSGTLVADLDPALTGLVAVPSPTSQTGNQLSWSYSNLLPGDKYEYEIGATVPATTPLGAIFNSTALVTTTNTDSDPSNNADTLNSVVFGAYDPNDKTVWPGGTISPAEVAARKELHYRIRFQNTGTDTAFSVVLRDTLSPNLDWSTFRMLGSSHSNTWLMKQQGELEWIFPNILLPDSNVNEPASHGQVEFAIKVLNSLALGDSIENTAAIYFDFNAPVITNTTSTVVALPVALSGEDLGSSWVSAYPIPVHNSLNLEFGPDTYGPVKAILWDIQGRMVHQTVFEVSPDHPVQAIDLKELPEGVYVLDVQSQGRSNRIRLLVKP